MKNITTFLLLFVLQISKPDAIIAQFTIRDVKSYAFPSELVTSAKGDKIALAMNEQGVRNIYVGEAPEFKLRKLTNYQADNGQEITSISLSSNGKWVVFVLGGEHGVIGTERKR